MRRIYFDSDDRADFGRYGLWLDRSRDDLGKIPGGPREGLIVTIHIIGEIEMEARLEWDAVAGLGRERDSRNSAR
jgi:hypothetical protein